MSFTRLGIIFLVLFLLKLAISFDYTKYLFCQFPEIKEGRLTAFTGDSFSYTGAMENYITKGEYYFQFHDKKVYAGRVPHYSIPYYLFRLVFNKDLSLDLFVAFQLLLESLAFFLASLIILDLTQSRFLFYLSLVFSVCSFFYLHFSLMPITDGPASSLLLISFWFLYRYLKSDTSLFRSWIYFSIVLALATILRPYFGLIFILIFLFVLFRLRLTFYNLFRHGFVYSITLLILLSPWIIRNYSRTGKIILFQEDKYAGYGVGSELELTRKMLAALGQDASTMWDRTTAAGFFSPSIYKISTWKVPPEITNDSILNSNFFAFRNLCVDSVDDKQQSDEYNSHYHAFINRYKSVYKIKYYFLNYVRRIKKFMIHSGSYYYAYDSNCGDRKNYYFKVLQSLLYYLCLIPGFAGLLLLTKQKKYGLIFLIPQISLLLIFPIVLGIIEWRYFLPFYFFNMVGVFYLLDRFLVLFRLKI